MKMEERKFPLFFRRVKNEKNAGKRQKHCSILPKQKASTFDLLQIGLLILASDLRETGYIVCYLGLCNLDLFSSFFKFFLHKTKGKKLKKKTKKV